MFWSIKEICDINKSSISRKDEKISIEYLDTSNLTENKIDSIQHYLLSDAPSRAQRRVRNNTILYSSVRPNLKHYGIMKNPANNFIVSTGFITLDIKDDFTQKIDPDYLYFSICQQHITDRLQTIAENSVSSYPSINPDDLAAISFDFPTYSEQRVIASVLSNLENKIALNRQINDNLLPRIAA